MAKRREMNHGSTGTENIRYFSPAARQAISEVRQGNGPYMKRLAAGDTAPMTKRRANQEANAQSGGNLPDYMFQNAAKGAYTKPKRRKGK